jgi:hypothetical protein
MTEKKSHGSRLNQRLTRWESVLAMVFVLDLTEEKVIFRSVQLPPWAKVGLKMAIVVGLLGAVLHFVNRRIDGGLSYTRSLGEKAFVPRIAMHMLLLAAVFTGFYWLKLSRFPWDP